MIIAVTGHRPDKLGNEWDLTGPYSNKIRLALRRILTNMKPTKIISGMALGVDTIWALLGLEMGIELIAAIPCKNHSIKWSDSTKKIYDDILGHSLTTTNYISEETYNDKCMQDRNVWMVNNCDMLVAVWDKSTGGTGNCVKYANSVKKMIIEINPAI